MACKSPEVYKNKHLKIISASFEMCTYFILGYMLFNNLITNFIKYVMAQLDYQHLVTALNLIS